MKLFQHSQGFIVAFGFDMVARKPNPRMISWSDPNSGDWQCSAINMAGDVQMAFDVAPEFVHESRGKIIAYQPGRCIEMTFIGAPIVWSIQTLNAEPQAMAQAA